MVTTKPYEKKAIGHATIAFAVFVAAYILDMTPLRENAQNVVPTLDV